MFLYEMSISNIVGWGCNGCGQHWNPVDSTQFGRISLSDIKGGLLEAYAVHSQLREVGSSDPRYDFLGFRISCGGRVVLAPVGFDYPLLLRVVEQLPGNRSDRDVFVMGDADTRTPLALYRCVQSILLQWDAQRRMFDDAEPLTGSARKSLTEISSDEDALIVLSTGLTTWK